MDLFDTLASFGLTTKVLQFIIIGSIAIFLIGMYWRYIVIGAGILFCVVVFAMPAKTVTTDGVVVTVPVLKPEDKAPDDFLEDCQHYNETSKSECEKIWKERS